MSDKSDKRFNKHVIKIIHCISNYAKLNSVDNKLIVGMYGYGYDDQNCDWSQLSRKKIESLHVRKSQRKGN